MANYKENPRDDRLPAVRVTVEERLDLEALAKRHNLSLSGYLYKLISQKINLERKRQVRLERLESPYLSGLEQ